MIKNDNYIFATVNKPWQIKIFNEVISDFPGNWIMVNNRLDLIDKCNCLNPRYVFFPHWNHLVPSDIVNSFECVCFHETDLPFGRGGSPIQNSIKKGFNSTVITALRMTDKIDAGPVYMKYFLSLNGLAEEIYLRSAFIMAKMILQIIIKNPLPMPQSDISFPDFERRKPEQSKIESGSINELFDQIRMLDAETYPKAFLQYKGFRFEFTRPALRTNKIQADVTITKV